jgi:UDP-2,3-diacylglucosamine hydrolase
MTEFDGILFSDVHLSPDTPRVNALFDAFVERVAGTPQIACLGDLTEYWIGTKHLRNDFGRHVNAQMQRLAHEAQRAIWVPGNRDFLFSWQAPTAGWQVCRNVYEGDFCGRRVAFEHGDRFCTLDREYQRFRMWFRRLPWRFMNLLISAERGHRMAKDMRGKSKGAIARKNPSAFGIQDAPVRRLIARGAEHVVCGHVHTPFSRQYEAVGKRGVLHVMSDWHEDGAVICAVKDGEYRLMRFDGDAFTPFDAPTEQAVFSGGA